MTAQAQQQMPLSSQDRPRSWLAPVVLVLWTLFVWGGRLRNLAADDGGLAAANRWSLIGSVLFVGLAGFVLVGLGLKWSSTAKSGTVLVLGAFTIVVWVVRAAGIAGAGHSIAFVAVHTALALMSIGLAVWAMKVTGWQRRLTLGDS